MKIGIDISQVIYGTGVSVYTEQLVKHLLEADQVNEYILFGSSLRRSQEFYNFFTTLKGKFVPKIALMPPTLAHLLWNKLHIVPIEAFIGKIDLFHSSDWTEPPASAPKVTTIHDLSPIKFPQLTHKKIQDTFKSKLFWVKKESDRIIVPSQATLNDLVLLGYNKDKIRVVYEALDPQIKAANSAQIALTKQKYNINKEFILCVGANKRKNIQGLINAYYRSKKLQEYQLVITGEVSQALSSKYKDVKFLGFTPRTDLPALYSGAACLAYPSFYEGFGLPILEAFSCNCPVVTSNTSSLPEVAGNAAVLIDPHSEAEIENGIIKALSYREKLIKLGKIQLKKFSWSQTALETLKVYKELI